MAPDGEHTIRLQPELTSVAEARRFVADVVGADDSSELKLMVSELLTNVIRHVGSEIRLTVRVGSLIRVEVHNHAAATEAFHALISSAEMPGPSSVGGRGLALVRRMATRIGLDDDPNGGKVVWFEYLPPAT